MSYSETLSEVNERESVWLGSFRITETSTGTGIPRSQIDTATMTIYDQVNGRIVNSQDATDVLASIGDTGADAGLVDITLVPDDTALTTTVDSLRYHVVLLRWTYETGTRAGSATLILPIRNQSKIT